MSLLHHLHKLLEIDFSISVLVNFSDSFLYSLLWYNITDTISRQKCNDLFIVDLTTAISIKHVECLLKVCFVHENVLVDGGSDKLCIVDIT